MRKWFLPLVLIIIVVIAGCNQSAPDVTLEEIVSNIQNNSPETFYGELHIYGQAGEVDIDQESRMWYSQGL